MQSDRLSSRWWRIADNTWILIMKRLVEHDIIQVYHQQDDTAACRPFADNDMIASSASTTPVNTLAFHCELFSYVM